MIQRPMMKVTYDSDKEEIFIVIAIIWSHQYPGRINMVEVALPYDRERYHSSYVFEPDNNGKYRCGLMIGELFYK